MDLVYFGINHPPAMALDTALEHAKAAIREAGFEVGEVDHADAGADGHASATIDVDPTLTAALRYEGELSFKGELVSVEAEWPD